MRERCWPTEGGGGDGGEETHISEKIRGFSACLQLKKEKKVATRRRGLEELPREKTHSNLGQGRVATTNGPGSVFGKGPGPARQWRG